MLNPICCGLNTRALYTVESTEYMASLHPTASLGTITVSTRTWLGCTCLCLLRKELFLVWLELVFYLIGMALLLFSISLFII